MLLIKGCLDGNVVELARLRIEEPPCEMKCDWSCFSIPEATFLGMG